MKPQTFLFATSAALLVTSMVAAQTSSTADVDKAFLHKSAQGNLAEIQLGKLALKKSHNQNVRAFANKMVHDHTKIMQNMRPIALRMGLSNATTLTSEDQIEMQRLRSMSGDEFNRQYVSAMVKDHQNDLRDFKQESESTADPSLKKTVDEAYGVIQHHAELVDQLAKNNGINVPGA